MRPLAGGVPVPLLARHDSVLLDLDGVLYAGPHPIPGAAETVSACRDAGLRIAFVTNNASRTPEAVAVHLRSVGIDADPRAVVTSAQAAATAVAGLVTPGAAVLVVGGEGLVAALLERGLRPVRRLDAGAMAVVQGFASDVGWEQLAQGTYAVRAGLPWIASNLDRTLPTGEGVAPGNGTLVEVIAMATGTRPRVVGKPDVTMHREALQRIGSRNPIVVGDRLDTDIEGAVRAGAPALLVLTGVTGPADLICAPPQQRPSYVAADLRTGLLHPHPPVHPQAGGGWSCGGWTCRVSSSGAKISGSGDPVDGLRAACVALWHLHDQVGDQVDPGTAADVVAQLGRHGADRYPEAAAGPAVPADSRRT